MNSFEMSRIILRAIIFISFLPTQVSAGPGEDLAAANSAYAGENWEEASRLYLGLLQAGYQSAALHYNLGNTYFQQDDPGRAVLEYMRALRIKPGDRATRHNLELAVERSRNEVIALPPFFLWRAWKGIFQLLPTDTWALLSQVALYIGLGGLAFWLLGRRSPVRRRSFAVGVTALLAGLLFFVLGKARMAFETDPSPAVLLAAQATLHSAADLESPAIREVYSGLIVRIEDQIGPMVKVRLQNGEEGWLEEKGLERVVEK